MTAPTASEIEAAITAFTDANGRQTEAQQAVAEKLGEAETANDTAVNVGAQVDTAGDELIRMVRLLRAHLDEATQPPVSNVLLAPRTGYFAVQGPEGEMDRQKLANLFYRGVEPPKFWADPSTSMRVFDDGSFRVWFEKARRTASPNSGGSSWVNAALPLSRAVRSARLSCRLTFANPWGGWGISGKLPGLMRWSTGTTPGGSVVDPGNYSVRGCWNDWDRNGVDIRFGPYVYSMDPNLPPESSDFYPVRYANGGTLLWYRPVCKPLDNPAGRTVHYTQTIQAMADGKQTVQTTIQGLDGIPRIASRIWDLAPGHNADITHVSFCFMYGGDTLAYGPAADTYITVSDFRVEELV